MVYCFIWHRLSQNRNGNLCSAAENRQGDAQNMDGVWFRFDMSEYVYCLLWLGAATATRVYSPALSRTHTVRGPLSASNKRSSASMAVTSSGVPLAFQLSLAVFRWLFQLSLAVFRWRSQYSVSVRRSCRSFVFTVFKPPHLGHRRLNSRPCAPWPALHQKTSHGSRIKMPSLSR